MGQVFTLACLEYWNIVQVRMLHRILRLHLSPANQVEMFCPEMKNMLRKVVPQIHQ